MAVQFTHIDHIGMGVESVTAQAEIFEGVFGFQRESTWEDDTARGIAFRFGRGGEDAIRWEIVEPKGDDSPIREFLDSPRGPGVHHIAFEVADLTATRQELQQLGIREADGSDDDRVLISADGGGEGIQLVLYARRAHEGRLATSPESSDRPILGITGIDHLCTAYPDRDVLSGHYTKLLGMKQIWRTPDGAWPDFGDCVLTIPGGQMHWEVIQPVGDDSFIQSFLDRRGPAIHHVAFEVADFDAAKRACEHYELPTFDEHDDSTDGIRWRDAFIHPKFTGGLLTQFYWEEQPGTWIHSDKVRPEGYTE